MKFNTDQFIRLAREYEQIEDKFCKAHWAKDGGCKKDCPMRSGNVCYRLYGSDWTANLSADDIELAVKVVMENDK